LGFAALLATSIQRVRRANNTRIALASLLLAIGLFALFSVSLPLSSAGRFLVLLTSVMTITFFSWKSNLIIKNTHWAWAYAAFTMALILLWSLAQAQPLQTLTFGISAGFAAFLSLRRGFKALQRQAV
jgi:hypothetical protein